MTGTEHGFEMRTVSPELCLVDPDLSAWCRLRLCEEAAAEEARQRESAHATPYVEPTPPAFVRATGTTSWPHLLGRQSVIAIAAVLLLGASGAASRPRPLPTYTAPPIVVTWPHIANARWYVVSVKRHSETIMRIDGLHQERLSLPHAWHYGAELFTGDKGTDRVLVFAVLNAGSHGRRVKLALDVPFGAAPKP